MSKKKNTQDDISKIPEETIRLLIQLFVGDSETTTPEENSLSPEHSWSSVLNIERKRQYSGKLSLDEIARGIYAANHNALRLLSDADLLFENQRYPSSVALSILAVEELGKNLILNGLVTLEAESDPKAIWKRFRDHKSKNRMWILPSVVANQGKSVSNAIYRTMFQSSDHPEILDWLKQFCLYTDCVSNREWQEPTLVSEDVARAVLKIARQLSANASMPENEILARLIKLHQVFAEGTPAEMVQKAKDYLKQTRGPLPP